MIIDDPTRTVAPQACRGLREFSLPASVAGRFRCRLVGDGSWLLASQVAAAAAMLVGVRLLTEALPPAVFASVSLVLGVLALGRNLLCFWIFQSALRFSPDYARRGELAGLRALILHFLSKSTTLLAALTATLGAVYCSWNHLSAWLVPVVVVLLLVENLRTFEVDLLNAVGRQRPYATLRAAEAWAKPICVVLLVWAFGPDVVVVMSGYLVASLIAYLCIPLLGVERVGVVGGGDCVEPPSREARERFLRFGLPLVPLAVMEWFSALSDRYLIGGLLGYEGAGVYIAGYGLVSLPFLLAQAVLEQLYRPLYYDALAGNDRARARKVYFAWFGVTFGVCLAGFLGVVLLKDSIAAVFLSRRYRGAGPLLPYIAAGNALLALSYVPEKIFHAVHKTKWCSVVRGVGAVSCVAVGVPLISRYGIAGAAWAVPVYYGIQFLVCVGLATREWDGFRRGGPD